jgi:hypothetical protein
MDNHVFNLLPVELCLSVLHHVLPLFHAPLKYIRFNFLQLNL